jgi:ankyrin repeat protein
MALIQFRFDYIEDESMEKRELVHNILQAAHAGELDEVKAAIRENPEAINLRHELTKSTALHFAAACGNYSIVEFLLTCEGVDVRAKDGYGRDVMDIAVERGHPGVIELIDDRMYAKQRLMDMEGRMPGDEGYNALDLEPDEIWDPNYKPPWLRNER